MTRDVPVGSTAPPDTSPEAGPPDVYARTRGLFAEGASPATIAAVLNADGLHTTVGRRWHPASVKRLLAQPPPDRAHGQPDLRPAEHLLSEPTRRDELLAAADSLRGALLPGSALVMVVMDIDDFRYVNSAFGHLEGDAILRQTAARLHFAVGGAGVSARIGSDAFAVVVTAPSCLPDPTQRMLEDLRTTMAPPFTTSSGVDVVMSMTMGAACEPGPTTVGISALLRRAELAMYHAKAEHLGWATYDAEADEADAAALVRANELRAAIASGQLTVHYQPVVDLHSGITDSVEALARWQHPERGLVPPEEFIPLAERFGLISQVTEAVIEQVAPQVCIWAAQGRSLTCAINVSATSLTDPWKVARLVPMLRQLEGSITIEVTESVMADAHAVRTLEYLAEVGIPSSIDDFGTGYSALGSLTRLPATALKLDRSLTDAIATDPRQRELVLAMVRLAGSFGLDTVAEGVETEAAALRLRDAGVQHGQGFWFSRPMPAGELELWLDAPPLLLPPSEDRSAEQEVDHRVLFHSTEQELVTGVAAFLTDSLSGQGHAVVVVDERQRTQLLSALPPACREQAEGEGRLHIQSARETLALFMREGAPDRELFEEHVASGVRELVQSAPTLGAYGEMVTILWQDGNATGALALEELWNELQRSHEFSLLCAYPLSDVLNDKGIQLGQLCHSHTSVLFGSSTAAPP